MAKIRRSIGVKHSLFYHMALCFDPPGVTFLLCPNTESGRSDENCWQPHNEEDRISVELMRTSFILCRNVTTTVCTAGSNGFLLKSLASNAAKSIFSCPGKCFAVLWKADVRFLSCQIPSAFRLQRLPDRVFRTGGIKKRFHVPIQGAHFVHGVHGMVGRADFP